MKLTWVTGVLTGGVMVSAGFAAEPVSPAVATNAAATNAAAIVLDTRSLWHFFTASGSTQVRKADGQLAPMDVTWYWGGLSASPSKSATHAPVPPADWASPEFDDSLWPRVSLPQPRRVIEGANPRKTTRAVS